jgi:ribosome-associated toxin RatA of RatAB toxin-antitoxin module
MYSFTNSLGLKNTIREKLEGKHLKSLCIISALSVLLFHSFTYAQGKEDLVTWKHLKNEDGIDVYKQQHANGLSSVKIESELESTPDQMIELLLKVDHYPHWIYNCQSASQISRSKNKIEYLITIQFPFPFQHRYAIIESTYEIGEHELIISSKNILRDPPRDDQVQIPFFEAVWRAQMTSSENVKITYIITSDPGGKIPVWLYNLFYLEAPIQTMKNLKMEMLENSRY